jgi:hypothetical protein
MVSAGVECCVPVVQASETQQKKRQEVVAGADMCPAMIWLHAQRKLQVG